MLATVSGCVLVYQKEGGGGGNLPSGQQNKVFVISLSHETLAN